MGKLTKSKKEELLDRHHQLAASIALQAVRISEMNKFLTKQCDSLLIVEAEIEKLELEEKGSGVN